MQPVELPTEEFTILAPRKVGSRNLVYAGIHHILEGKLRLPPFFLPHYE
jgi:hypothetical protein